MEPPKRFPVIGIGASAGGVEALQALFRAMPHPALDVAFVVVTHLGPNHESALPDILGDCTAMPVIAAADGQAVRPGQVYVLSHEAVITIADGRLALRDRALGAARERQPIDVFFASLAADCGERAVGIVLSGSGSDGTLGLKAIKAAGGLTLSQGGNGDQPRYPDMPASAVAGGVVDVVLPVGEMPARLAELAPALLAEAGAAEAGDAIDAGALAATHAGETALAQAEICGILRERIGHDFAGYKDKTFFRRVQRRIQVLRLADPASYIKHLRDDPEEAGILFRDLLIGVTGFFRDPDAFAALEAQVIPAMFEGRTVADPLRVWVPGCATGEEAYSVAILLREHMDRHPGGPRPQIFATDIDDTALAVARRGRYPEALLTGVSPERLARFFVPDGTSHVASKDLRDLCVFSPHSIIRDPPFSRIDLVSCRNLLIYLGSGLQEQAIPLFHYALRPGGFLFLGVSETVSRHGDLFDTVDRGHCIYRRRDTAVPAGNVPLFVQQIVPGGRRPWSLPVPPRAASGGAANLRLAAESYLLDRVAPPYVVINRDGDVVHQSARLGAYLEPAAGPPTRQLLSIARRGLRSELRVALREAAESGRAVVRPRVEVVAGDRTQAITLTVAPLPAKAGAEPLFLVMFADLGPPQPHPAAEARPGDAGAESAAVEQLETELRETRAYLQSSVEEYETATEDLRSANEEMVSVNEELQSTNEELETSKEELQSVNEELRTVNLELSGKVEQLDRANADLRNLFDSTGIATVFLDNALAIRSFTPAATSIFTLVPSDQGRPLTDFASRLGTLDLPGDMASVLASARALERRITTQDAKTHYIMRILPYRNGAGQVDGLVLTFLDVTKVVDGEILGTLVDELNHRVRNMLQVVVSVAAHTLRRSTTLAEFGETFAGRIQSLSRAHELVTLGGGQDIPLQDLVLKELKPYAAGTDRIVTRGEPARLKPKAALPLCMVLHELATNAAKHGALSTDTGQVTIDWGLEGQGPAARFVLHWVEGNGPRIIGTPERRGFGSQLIERLLKHDLGGVILIEMPEAGLRATLSLSPEVIFMEHPPPGEGTGTKPP